MSDTNNPTYNMSINHCKVLPIRVVDKNILDMQNMGNLSPVDVVKMCMSVPNSVKAELAKPVLQ